MIKNISFQKSQGFSMVELMVSLGISGMLTLLVSNMATNVNTELKSLTSSANITIDESTARRVMLKDLLQSSPSFNYLTTNGKVHVPADYDAASRFCTTTTDGADFPFWKITNIDICGELHFTMDQAGQSFQMITVDQKMIPDGDGFKRKEIVFTDPGDYYTDSGTALTFNTSAVTSFLTAQGHSSQVFKIMSNAPVLDGTTPVDYAIMQQYHDGTLTKFNNPDINLPTIIKDHCDTTSIDTLNTFLRCIPSAGSMARSAWIPVRVIVYELNSPDDEFETGFHLVKKVYLATSSSDTENIISFVLARNIKEVKVVRKNSSDSLVDIVFDIHLKTRRKPGEDL